MHSITYNMVNRTIPGGILFFLKFCLLKEISHTPLLFNRGAVVGWGGASCSTQLKEGFLHCLVQDEAQFLFKFNLFQNFSPSEFSSVYVY